MSEAKIKPAVLDLPSVSNYLSLSESTVQNMVREARLPKPRLLTGRRVGWLTREIDEWAESRPIANLLPPGNTGAIKMA